MSATHPLHDRLLPGGAVELRSVRLGFLPYLSVWRRITPFAYATREVDGIYDPFVGESAVLMAEIQKIPRYAATRATVLITGERGTGKGVAARAIHNLSPRATGAWMTVNCGNINPELLESHLFGHVKGAFTGANCASQGLLRDANGGTLFMDETEGMTLPVQLKLLNFLEEKQFTPLGSSTICKVDVRIVAATNINIGQAVKDGRIREDLYDRLNVLRLQMPSLRERMDDIPLLARHFLERFAREQSKLIHGFAPATFTKLQAYDWPGNVRVLRNVIERVPITILGPL